jgi:hypothetical protein
MLERVWNQAGKLNAEDMEDTDSGSGFLTARLHDSILGAVRYLPQICSLVGAPNLNPLPSEKPRVHRPGPGTHQRKGDAKAGQQNTHPRIMTV